MPAPGFGEKLRAVFGLSPTILCLTGMGDGRIRDVRCGAEPVCTWTIDELRAGDRVRLCARTDGQADLADLNAPNLAIVQRENRCAELRAESSTTAVVSVRNEQAMP